VDAKQNNYDSLISWDVSNDDLKGKNIAPYVEAGYKGDMLLDYFYKVLSVTTVDDKDGLSYILKQAYESKHP
jgi:hypothetical protein